MSDPTYNKEEISNNKVWSIAWIISECLNDNAPIGWAKYIWIADQIRTEQIRDELKRLK